MNSKSIAWHLNKNGLSDTLMKDLLFKANVGSLFQGIFPLQTIPNELAIAKSFVIIVNIGYHFVTIYTTDAFIYYIDSFGKKPPQSLYKSFLNSCNRPIFFNPIQIQSKQSTHCGFFSCLFTLFYSKKNHNMKLKFVKDKNQLQKNNELCIKFLKQLCMK